MTQSHDASLAADCMFQFLFTFGYKHIKSSNKLYTHCISTQFQSMRIHCGARCHGEFNNVNYFINIMPHHWLIG